MSYWLRSGEWAGPGKGGELRREERGVCVMSTGRCSPIGGDEGFGDAEGRRGDSVSWELTESCRLLIPLKWPGRPSAGRRCQSRHLAFQCSPFAQAQAGKRKEWPPLSNHLPARKKCQGLFKLSQKTKNQEKTTTKQNKKPASGMDRERSKIVHTAGPSCDLPYWCPLLGLWEEELACVHRWADHSSNLQPCLGPAQLPAAFPSD